MNTPLSIDDGNYHRALGISSDAARAWVAVGANVGAPQRAVARALRWLGATPGIAVQACSTLRWTAPVGGPPQPPYLNGVVRLRTTLSPRALLGVLQQLEAAARRRRAVRWGPRTLDLDLLMYGVHGERVCDDAALTLPHPRLHERAFVLEPLVELDPTLRHPHLDQTMSELLHRAS